jgi:transposase
VPDQHEACVGAHHLSRKLSLLGHDARLMPAKYVRQYCKGEKNDYRDAEAIAEAVQRPTMKFVATKTAEQLDLQALHRVRERLVSQCNREINAALADPSIKARFADLGGVPMPLSPADFGKFIAGETEKWGKVIRAADIKAE